jgi:ribosomal protein S18 acetylase RimI-like enzyme
VESAGDVRLGVVMAMATGKIVVRRGRDEDVLQCHELLTRLLLPDRAGREHEEHGFLVVRATLPELRDLFASADAWVADSSGIVVGFVVAFLTESAHFRRVRGNHVEQWESLVASVGPSATYIDRLAVAPECRRRGIARRLYRRVFRAMPPPFVALLVERPVRNEASIRFHRAAGFERTGSLQFDEYCGLQDFASGIYIRNSRPAEE